MLKIHAIVKALNEEHFILEQLKTLYPVCSRISILTQYDRDWYGKLVIPDRTIPFILDFPDPEGKIHLVIRKFPDETAAVNMEMLAFNKKSFREIIPHGSLFTDIRNFHDRPDYFWYVDADEIYDVDTIPAILDFLEKKSPRGLRITGYNYVRDWNHRVPRSVVDFTHFGFIKAGLLLEQHRTLTWNESRLSKLLLKLHLPDISSRIFGFLDCPESVGVFHHGCWLGNNERLRSKFEKSSHIYNHLQNESNVDDIETVEINTRDLPSNIREGRWPQFYLNFNG